MNLAAYITVLVAAFATGYLTRAVGPWRRLANWADRQLAGDGRWWIGSGPRTVLVASVYLLTWPHAAVHAWRHRNDPEPEPLPPVYDRGWMNRNDTTEE